METEIKKIVNKQFPELASGYHLPRLARVESISDHARDHLLNTPYRNYYAVDIKILNEQCEIDESLPLFRDVPLPVPGAGIERGTFAYPEPGTIVEVAFAYGLPDQIFIRTILPYGIGLPTITPGDHLTQTAPGVFDRTTVNGDKERSTYGSITDTCSHYQQDVLSSFTNTLEHRLNAEANSTETITGTKSIETLGALTLGTAGHCSLAAANNLNITTASDHQVSVANHFTTRVGGINDSLAALKQLIRVEDRTGKVWLGNESHNVLDLLSQLMAVVKDMADTLETHTHQGVTAGTAVSGAPVQASKFATASSQTSSIKSNLDPIIEP